MTKNIAIATLKSAILGLAMIGSAHYWRLGLANGPADRSYPLEELARYDGKNGNECLVASTARYTS